MSHVMCAYFSFRVCEQTVGKYTVPAGDTIFAAPSVSMRLGSVFTNPDTFDPDRFSEERKEDSVRFSFIGFGGGMHACTSP